MGLHIFFFKDRQLVFQDFFSSFTRVIFYKTMNEHITSDQSVARFIASTLEDRFKELVLKYFLIISGVIFLHTSRIHFVTVKLEILKRKSTLKVECLKILKNKIIKMSATVIVNLCVQ